MLRVVTDRFDYAKALGTAFAEEEPIAWSKVLRTLNEAECNCCTVSCADKLSVDVNDGTSLGNGTNVEHGLVFGLDGGGMGENED
jgi:hypothetical protein